MPFNSNYIRDLHGRLKNSHIVHGQHPVRLVENCMIMMQALGVLILVSMLPLPSISSIMIVGRRQRLLHGADVLTMLHGQDRL